MLVELHLIQNHSPSNLNRDDLGAPKSCLFGGVARARISSQCLKRSIRRGVEFQEALKQEGGVRTRRLIDELAQRAEKGGVKRTGKGEEPNNTNILLFIPESAIEKMAAAVRDAKKQKAKPEMLCQTFAAILGEKAAAPDIALGGRMTELDPKGGFRGIDFTVEAALAAAHAISTHQAMNEVDYFTAVDDLAVGTGAGHVNEAMLTSACFYKYFCIDWDQLVHNLNGDVARAQQTLKCFVHAAAKTTPTGKQKSFAPFNLPDGILAEIKTKSAVAVNYANAFADPVPLESARGLVGESVARLGQHVYETIEGYGIPAERLWFSPCGRYPLTRVVKADNSQSEKAVLAPEATFSSFDGLVEKVLSVVGVTEGA